MWPMRLDLSRDECKKCLRCLELEAYGSMVSVLRAQGSFTNEKQKLLQELAKALHISNERHRAEIRRAVNDEKLSTIAEQLNGPNTGTDWAIEGRRTIPLLPRLNARTVFTSLANSLSLATSVANAKKASTSREEVGNLRVKVETESVIDKVEENGLPPNTTSTQPEAHSISRKRRRSRVEFQDVSGSVNQLNDAGSIVRDMVTSFSCEESESSPVPVSLSNKVFIISTSAALDIPRNNIIDSTAELSSVNSSCSATNTNSQQNLSIHPSGSSHITSHATVPCKAVITQTASYTHAPTQVIRSISTVVPAYLTTATTTSKTRAKVISTEAKVQSRVSSIAMPTTVAQHGVTKSIPSEVFDIQASSDGERRVKLVQLTSCVPNTARSSASISSACMRRITTTTYSNTKPTMGVKTMTSQTGPRMVAVSTGVASNGPGPPQMKSSTAVLTCKKMPAVQTSNQATKTGITLNSSKTVNVASNPSSRVAAKANVIVVQKGPARGVTLSHAGKEVLGKVIMGGKNLCLTNQQSAGTIALMPHRISTNGEQSLAMLSSINSSQSESGISSTKSGNMIVLDLRQDSLEKSKVLSEILEASGVFSSESKTAILNTNSHLLNNQQNKDAQSTTCPISKSSHIKSGSTISFVMDTKEHRISKESIVNMDPDKADSPAKSKIEDSEEELVSANCISELQGTLDPQTGIYSFQTSDNAVSNVQTDTSVSSPGIDIFSTALSSADINLESFQYIDDSESNNVLGDVRNQILTIDQLNDLYEGDQSLSDKSNC